MKIDLKVKRIKTLQYLSTSELVLIWGEAALAWEKFWLYKPDITDFLVWVSAFSLRIGRKTKVEKEGLVGAVVCRREKGETDQDHHQ